MARSCSDPLSCERCDSVATLRSPLLGPVCRDCFDRFDSGGVFATPLAAVEREQVRWLLPGRVPLGMLTLLMGDPGLGKSLFSLDLASMVTQTGRDVIVLSAEDHAGATIRPRAEAAGANLERLHVAGVRRDGLDGGFVLPDDVDDLGDLVLDLRAQLVIVDPLTAHLADAVNSWRDQSVRRAMAPLHRLAEQQRCAVMVVVHLNKGTGSNALYRAGGSIGIPAAVRSALLLARDPHDPERERGSRRVLAHVKCNIGKQAESLACVIESVNLDESTEAPKLTVTGSSAITASDLLEGPDVGERTERDEAVEYLRTELANGQRPARELFQGAPCGERTLKKAKADLGVVSSKDGFTGSWVWRLPESPKKASTKEAQAIYAPLPPSQTPPDVGTIEGVREPRVQRCTDTADPAPLVVG